MSKAVAGCEITECVDNGDVPYHTCSAQLSAQGKCRMKLSWSAKVQGNLHLLILSFQVQVSVMCFPCSFRIETQCAMWKFESKLKMSTVYWLSDYSQLSNSYQGGPNTRDCKVKPSGTAKRWPAFLFFFGHKAACWKLLVVSLKDLWNIARFAWAYPVFQIFSCKLFVSKKQCPQNNVQTL